MKTNRLLALATVAVLVLAACSGNADTASLGGDASERSSPQTTVVAGFDDGEGFETTEAAGEAPAESDAAATNAQAVVDTKDFTEAKYLTVFTRKGGVKKTACEEDDSRQASIIASHSRTVMAMGFSTNTCLPCRAAAMVCEQ